MSRIIQPGINIIDPIRANDEMMYALKHHKDGLKFQGIWQADQYRDGKLISGGHPEPPNIFTTVGMGRLLDIIFWETAKAASKIWYVGIFKNNVTPALANVAATALGAAGTYGECQDADYDDPATNKPSYNTATTAIATITNSANKAAFVMNASITVYGAFLSSSAAKTAVDGYLMAAKKFAASRAVIADDELSITYTITTTSS